MDLESILEARQPRNEPSIGNRQNDQRGKVERKMNGVDTVLYHWLSMGKVFPQGILDEWWRSEEISRPQIKSLSKGRNDRNEESCVFAVPIYAPHRGNPRLHTPVLRYSRFLFPAHHAALKIPPSPGYLHILR